MNIVILHVVDRKEFYAELFNPTKSKNKCTRQLAQLNHPQRAYR